MIFDFEKAAAGKFNFCDKWLIFLTQKRYFRIDYYETNKYSNIYSVALPITYDGEIWSLNGQGLWIFENLNHYFAYNIVDGKRKQQVIWYFSDENEALMFKLRFTE